MYLILIGFAVVLGFMLLSAVKHLPVFSVIRIYLQDHKRKIAWITAAVIVITIALSIIRLINIPVIGLMAHENRIIVSADESHTELYTAFDDDFSYSDKGKFAGVVKGAYQTYAAYYVKGDDSHKYLYVDSCFYKKLPSGTEDDGNE